MKNSNGQLGGVVESVCAILSRWSAPQPFEEKADKNGILVLYPTSEKNANTLMFIFVTPDNIRIELPFDLALLKKDGKTYFNKAIEGVVEGIEQYRKKRKATGPLIVLPESRPIELLSPGAIY